MLDIHSHILHGVDDGAQTLEEACAMVSAAKAAGVTAIVATPHVRDIRFDMARARDHFDALRLAAEALDMPLFLGFEVHWNVFLSISPDQARRYCREGTEDILVEFSTHAPLPYDAKRKLYQLQREGLRVIIAHPERYRAVHRDIGVAQEWLDMGCALQLDATALLYPLYGANRHCARTMLRRGMYEYVASDAHEAADYGQLKKALQWIAKHKGDTGDGED